MRLRERFILTLFGIALILVTPAVYGLRALQELRDIATDFRSRDAIGYLSLGRLQAAFSEVDRDALVYLALGAEGAEGNAVRERVLLGMERVDSELRVLSSGEYEEDVQGTVQAWTRLREAIVQEHRLLLAGQDDSADVHRAQVVDPAVRQMDASLDPIGVAIRTAGDAEVRQAQAVAEGAQSTTLIALAVALGVALIIAGWLTRAVVSPIHALRRAMAVVAAGDFSPELSIAPGRNDEIGDLARSFRWMTRQLSELERLRAQFVAVASHELKTPLSVIKGYVSLIREGIYGTITEDQEKVLTAVSDQSDRLGRLIQQLLDISRFEAGGGRLEIQPIDLKPFLTELAVSFEALALQNDIDFKLDVGPDLPPTIEADPDRLNEVVGNLLSNAFKFTPRKGRIVLSARVGSRRGDDRVVVEVRDTGVGIPEDQLPRIFEKFYQVENQAQPLSVGSGLGLAISKEIVEAHGGTIAAESELGAGTVIRVFLPLAPHLEEGATLPHAR